MLASQYDLLTYRLAREALRPGDDVRLMQACIEDAKEGRFDEITHAQLPRTRDFFARLSELTLSHMNSQRGGCF